MKCLITGVNGFIGSNISSYLMELGIEVQGVDIHETSKVNLVKYYQRDIRYAFTVPEEYDFVIHLAGISVTNVNADYDYDTIRLANVEGTKHIVESCIFQKFIFYSSTLVYLRDRKEVDEQSEICLDSLYSRTKFEAEDTIRNLLPEEKVIILRSVNVTGVGQKNVAFLPIFFEKAIKNEDINIFVPSNKRMQLLDVQDVCILIGKIVAEYGDTYGIFNIAPEESKSILEITQDILKVTNSSSKILCTNQEVDKESIISSKKAREQFHWNVTKSINDILLEFYIKKCNEVY